MLFYTAISATKDFNSWHGLSKKFFFSKITAKYNKNVLFRHEAVSKVLSFGTKAYLCSLGVGKCFLLARMVPKYTPLVRSKLWTSTGTSGQMLSLTREQRSALSWHERIKVLSFWHERNEMHRLATSVPRVPQAQAERMQGVSNLNILFNPFTFKTKNHLKMLKFESKFGFVQR